MKQIKIILVLLILTFVVGCCQYKELKTFTKCEFKLDRVENLKLAGVDIQNVKKLTDLHFLKAGKITSATLQGKLPLEFTVFIKAKNPNSKNAAINKLEWIAFIDDVELLNGVMEKRIEISADGGTADIPLEVRTDLKEVFSSESATALINLALNLVDLSSEKSKIGVKIKPTIKVGKKYISYPGYIKLKKKFSSN